MEANNIKRVVVESRYKEYYNRHFKCTGMPEYEILSHEDKIQVIDCILEQPDQERKMGIQRQFLFKYSGIEAPSNKAKETAGNFINGICVLALMTIVLVAIAFLTIL